MCNLSLPIVDSRYLRALSWRCSVKVRLEPSLVISSNAFEIVAIMRLYLGPAGLVGRDLETLHVLLATYFPTVTSSPVLVMRLDVWYEPFFFCLYYEIHCDKRLKNRLHCKGFRLNQSRGSDSLGGSFASVPYSLAFQ